MTDIPAKTLELIGFEKVRSYEVTHKDIKRFAQAIDDPNPKFRCNDSGLSATNQSVVGPPLICQMFAFEDVEIEELPPDGSPIEINIPLPANKTVGGGSVFEIFGQIRSGDRITVKSKIADIYKKEGRSGTLFFVSVETSFYNQNNNLVSRETATFIKR
jgi:hydroxyacyl-ACP dehydratase HTD2-like protein with hotdog domain